jgi:hypothetical protein
MDIRSKKTRKIDEQLKKIRGENPTLKPRLDASQNALRVVEQAIGGKLVEKPIKTSQRPS